MRFRMFDRYSENTSFRLIFSSRRPVFRTVRGYLPLFTSSHAPSENVLIVSNQRRAVTARRSYWDPQRNLFVFWRKPPYPLPGRFLGPASPLIVCVGVSPDQSDFHTPPWARSFEKVNPEDPPFPNVSLKDGYFIPNL